VAKPSSGHDDTLPADAGGNDVPLAAAPPEKRYQLGAELGRGGMGRVVEAIDTHLGRTVAFKEVIEGGSPSLIRRFQREVRITARLEHASIVPLYDSGIMPDGRPFYVMRRVSGRPLLELIDRARSLAERLALLPRVLAAADAIAHAHRRGVIHRDLKPANILVGELGETVVIDWGLAKVLGEADPEPESVEPQLPGDSLRTQAGAVFGTPGFMAPEQARGGELSPRSDVFALGATLYQLLAGKPPVRGTSATEVIASTARTRIAPLTSIAPGTPAELAAIIDKALAYEPERRYAHAGELAEDLRRFTTGQLVAAHRYTTAQRLVRFARRHRAALSITALAASAVAVMSWFSVHRILQERDVANHARAEAEQQRAVAAREAKQARDRSDQLLVSHARGELDSSPVATVAALAHIEHPEPPLADEITALVKAAMARGVAWGLPTLPDLITSFEMTDDGKRLLELDRRGRLQVLDLDSRKSVLQHEIVGAFQAKWVNGDRQIFMLRGKRPPALFDPATNTLDDIAPAMHEYVKAPHGDTLGYIDDTGVGIFDVATRKATPLWQGKASGELAIAQDASWLAFADATKHWHVVDRSGRMLVEQPGQVQLFAASPTGKLAILQWGKLVETRPSDPAHAIATVPIDPNEARLVHAIGYRGAGDALVIFSAREMLTWTGTHLLHGNSLDGSTLIAFESAAGMVATANDSRVHVLRDGFHMILPLTAQPMGFVRVATSPTTSRIAATAKDAVLLWNLEGLMPKSVPDSPGVFVGARTVLLSTGLASAWQVWDVEHDTHKRLVPRIDGMPAGYQVGDDGRVLATVMTERGNTALVIYPDLKKQVVVAGASVIGMVPGDGLVYSLGKGRVFGKIGDEEPRELVTLQGDVQALASNGTLAYAALARTGELVHGTFSGADFARTQVKDLASDAFVACAPDHAVFIGSGNRLLRWRTTVDEIARFTDKIESIVPTEIGTYVVLGTREVLFLAAQGDQTPRRVPIASSLSIVAHGKRVVGLAADSQIEIVEMPSFAKWTLPKLYAGGDRLSVSPDGRFVFHAWGTTGVLWKLPETVPPLYQLTNASEEDGAIAWPWNP